MFWRCRAPSERRRRELPSGGLGGILPQEIFKIEHTETPKTQFATQGWSSLKFSIKGKFFNEIGQLDREQGDREGD